MLTGGQSALVPTTHPRFPRASNANDYQDFMRYVNSATNVLLTLNSAVNFLIYCLLGKKFRRIFVDMFCGCMPCYHRRRPSSVDQSDIQLVTGKRSTVPSRAVPPTSLCAQPTSLCASSSHHSLRLSASSWVADKFLDCTL